MTKEQIKFQVDEALALLRSCLCGGSATITECLHLEGFGYSKEDIMVGVLGNVPIPIKEALQKYSCPDGTLVDSIGLKEFDNISITYFVDEDNCLFDVYDSEVSDTYAILEDIEYNELDEAFEEYLSKGERL